MTESSTSTEKRSPLVELFLTIKSWFLFLLSKWLILLIVGIIGGVLGILYAYTTKPVYQSRLTFALDEGGSGSMSGAIGIAAQLGINIGGSNNDVFGGDNILEIIKSRRNIETVLLAVDSSEDKPVNMVTQFLAITNWAKKYASNDRLNTITFPAGITKKELSYLQDSVLYLVYDDIITNLLSADHPDKRLNVFEVNMISPNEKFTKVFTDKLVSYATDFYTFIRTKKSLETLGILQARADATKAMLKSSITSKAVTQDANTNPAFEAAQAPVQEQQANIQVYGGAYAELYKNMELARFQYLKDIPLLQIIDAADYPMKKIKLSRAKAGMIGGLLAVAFVFFILVIKRFLKDVEQ